MFSSATLISYQIRTNFASSFFKFLSKLISFACRTVFLVFSWPELEYTMYRFGTQALFSNFIDPFPTYALPLLSLTILPSTARYNLILYIALIFNRVIHPAAATIIPNSEIATLLHHYLLYIVVSKNPTLCFIANLRIII
jgi:hypothetical protein